MITAVLGSGNGGCAVAFDCARHGHEVRLFDFEAFPHTIEAVQSQGGIHSTGELEGFAPIAWAGHDVAEALDAAQLVYAVGPAFSTEAFAAICGPHLRDDQIVIVCPGSCMGSLAFRRTADPGMGNDRLLVAETSTLPYAVRAVEAGRIHVFLKLKGGLFLSALPARHTDRVLARVRDVYPAMDPARDIFHTSLQNGNPVIHPAVTLLNAALIERTAGAFLFYEEGVTPAVGRLIRAIDRERIAIGRALGLDIMADPELGCSQGYMTEPSYSPGYAQAPGFRGIRAQNQLEHRYLLEDVGYGLVFFRSLAERVGVETPCMTAVIGLASEVLGRPFLQEGKRTLESLGLSGLSVDQLIDAVA